MAKKQTKKKATRRATSSTVASGDTGMVASGDTQVVASSDARQMRHTPVETIDPRQLTPHPNNYRTHPDDQLEHIIHSIEEHGLYRNIVVAQDNTILAGHGVVQATLAMGLSTVPVIKLPIDPMSPPALRLLAGDNEIGKMAEVDDRVLTNLLRELKEGAGENGGGLLGTGYTEQMLSALVFVTRDANEVSSFDAAEEWVGLPDYEAEGRETHKLVMNFRSKKDRVDFVNTHKIELQSSGNATAWSAWWPEKKRAKAFEQEFVEEP